MSTANPVRKLNQERTAGYLERFPFFVTTVPRHSSTLTAEKYMTTVYVNMTYFLYWNLHTFVIFHNHCNIEFCRSLMLSRKEGITWGGRRLRPLKWLAPSFCQVFVDTLSVSKGWTRCVMAWCHYDARVRKHYPGNIYVSTNSFTRPQPKTPLHDAYFSRDTSLIPYINQCICTTNGCAGILSSGTLQNSSVLTL
jgi:hypothetical protein